MQQTRPQLLLRTMTLLMTVLAVIAVGASSALAASSGSGFYIRGGGFGHDIGMSQYGAGGFAEHGWNYKKILSWYYSHTKLGTVSTSRTVTVLLKSGDATFSGASTIAGSKTKLKPGTNYGVVPVKNKLEIISGGRKIGKFNAPLTVSGSGPLDLVGQGRYRGKFVFRFASDGVDTINQIGLNDYVRGVIAAEMPSDWPQQALRAQAVAARTYAITSGSVDPGKYMLYDDTRSQMYEGVSAETSATNQAVAATASQVVEYNGVPVTTYFFSSSGGHTKSIQYSWGVSPDAWLVGVADPYDDSFGNPYHSWKKNLGLGKAADKLVGYVRGSLRGIKVTAKDAQIVGSGGTSDVDGYDLESSFNTLSPNMTFTTISDHAATATVSASSSSSSSSSSPGSGSSGGGTALVRPAAKAKTKKVHEVAGTIYPVHKGRLVTAQLDTKSGWKSVKSEKLPGSGKFAIRVSSTGRYRVLYNKIDGPTFTIK